MAQVTEVIILLDRSGSMAAIQEATVRGINNFINDVNKVPGEGYWSFYQFDDPASALGAKEAFPHTVFERVHYREVPRLEAKDFLPRNSTALVDATCLTIQKVRERYLASPESRRPRVLIVIMTDGMENASRQFTADQMRQLIAEVQSSYKWEFIYLGANQDTFAVAKDYGVKTSQAFHYTANAIGTTAVLASGAVCARGWKAEGNKSVDPLMGSSQPDVQVNVNINQGTGVWP